MGYNAVPALGSGQNVPFSAWTILKNNDAYFNTLLAAFVTNVSGVQLTDGDVVVILNSADGNVDRTTTPGDTQLVGVVQGTIDIGQTGYVAVHGHVGSVKVQGTVGRQVDLQTSATAGRAEAGAVFPFARSITQNPSGAGTVEAFVHNATLATPAPTPWSRILAFS
jgi:hypothetical protein